MGYGKSTLRNFESGDRSVSYIACAFKKTSYSFIPLLERRLLAIIEPSTRLLPFAGLLGVSWQADPPVYVCLVDLEK